MSENQSDRRNLTLMQKLAQPEATAPPWSLTNALLTGIVLLVCLTIVGPALSSIVLGTALITSFLLILSWALGMALTIIFVLVNRRSSPESWRALRLLRGSLPLPITLLLGVAIAVAIDLIVSLASARFLPVPEILGFQTAGTPSLITAALLLILLQPLADTLVFQAVLLPSLRWTLGPRRGLIATTALYTVLHILVFTGIPGSRNDLFWYHIFYPACLGLAYCALKVYTGSSGAVLVARMGGGLILFLTALTLVSP